MSAGAIRVLLLYGEDELLPVEDRITLESGVPQTIKVPLTLKVKLSAKLIPAPAGMVRVSSGGIHSV